MLLIPPDCSQSDAIQRIAYSLKSLQDYTNYIFSNANRRLRKCQERIDFQLARIEVIGKKVSVLEQNGDDVFVFHSAPKYPAVGCEGLRKSFYECLMGSFLLPENDMMDVTTTNICTTNQLTILKERMSRKKNVGMFTYKLQKVDIDELKNPLHSTSKFQNPYFTQVLTKNTPQKYTSTQIDFSSSLLDGLETLNSSICDIVFSDGNEAEAAFLEVFNNSRSESNDLDEQIEFDLPVDLPGFDTKSLSARSVSNVFRSDVNECLLIRKNEANNESEPMFSANSVIEQTDEDKGIMAERTKTGTATNTLSNEVTRDSSQTNVQTLPPPPPPPPPPPQQAYHGRVVSDRSDLMAAIRATGGVQGAGLKSVKKNAEPISPKKESEEEDLMSSLTRVLAMRRRGILGENKPTTLRSMGDVLRQQIPTRTRNESSSEEDQPDNEVGINEWADE